MIQPASSDLRDKKNWIPANSLVLAAALLVSWLSGCNSDSQQHSAPTIKLFDGSAVETIAVEKEQIIVESYFDGIVEAVNQASVSAQTSGRIIELPFDVGDFVVQGDVIARLTDTQQQAAVASAIAQLEEANALFTEANLHLKRVSDVYKQGLVSQSDFNQATAAQKAAAARVESAEAARKDAEDRLSYTVIVAPYSGIVVSRLTDIGASVTAGTPIIEGLSLNQLRIQVDIPQQHIGPLRLHKKARVLLPGAESIEVTDLRIPPSADPATHSFRVLMQLPDGNHSTPIFPGTLAKVAFVQGQAEQLVIPTNAVAMRGEVTGVYVLTENKTAIEFRYIRLGQKLPSGKQVVLSGLEAGENIAQDPVAAASAYKTQHFSDHQ